MTSDFVPCAHAFSSRKISHPQPHLRARSEGGNQADQRSHFEKELQRNGEGDRVDPADNAYAYSYRILVFIVIPLPLLPLEDHPVAAPDAYGTAEPGIQPDLAGAERIDVPQVVGLDVERSEP